MWGKWSSWSSCSEPCGLGHRTRYRAISRNADHSGRGCEGDWHEIRGCMVGTCTTSTTPAPDLVLPILSTSTAFLVGCCLIPLLVVCIRRRRLRQREKEELQRKEEDEANIQLLEQMRLAEETQRREEEELQRRRDEEGWIRLETQRREREEQQRRSAEARRKRFKDSGAQTEVVTCPGRHELRPPRHQERKWVCDGRNAAGGCKSGITAYDDHVGVARFRCEACDYDLCQNCYKARQVVAASSAASQSSTRVGGAPGRAQDTLSPTTGSGPQSPNGSGGSGRSPISSEGLRRERQQQPVWTVEADASSQPSGAPTRRWGDASSTRSNPSSPARPDYTL